MIAPTLQESLVPLSASLGFVVGLLPLVVVRWLGKKLVPDGARTYFEKNPVNHWLRRLDRQLQARQTIGNRAPYVTESVDWLLHVLPFALPLAVLDVSPSAPDWFERYRLPISLGLVSMLTLISGYYWGVADTRFNRLNRRESKKSEG